MHRCPELPGGCYSGNPSTRFGIPIVARSFDNESIPPIRNPAESLILIHNDPGPKGTHAYPYCVITMVSVRSQRIPCVILLFHRYCIYTYHIQGVQHLDPDWSGRIDRIGWDRSLIRIIPSPPAPKQMGRLRLRRGPCASRRRCVLLESCGVVFFIFPV